MGSLDNKVAFVTGSSRGIGAAIAGLSLPTIFVQEGGYLSDALGDNLTHVLQGYLTA